MRSTRRFGIYHTMRAGIKKIDFSTVLNPARNRPFSLSFPAASKVLVAGGDQAVYGQYNAQVESFNTALVRTAETSLSLGRTDVKGGVNNYAIFGGGYNNYQVDNTDAYTSSMVRSTPTALSSTRDSHAVASIGEYVIFAGGNSGSSKLSTLDAFNNSLVRSNPTALSQAKYDLAGDSFGGYAIFTGGYAGSSTYSSAVETYNSSLVKGTATSLASARAELSAAHTSTHLFIFAGRNSSYTNTVDIYNSSMVKLTSSSIATAKSYTTAISFSGFAMVAAGESGNAEVEAFNLGLVRSTLPSLSVARFIYGGAVGKYAIFPGGYTTQVIGTIDAYEVTS